MKSQSERYIPALGYRALTGLYDPVVALTTREATFKPALAAQAAVRLGDQVLDLACGTGTLAVLLKQKQPGARIVGVDGDPDVLRIAERKAARAGVDVEFRQSLSDRLPYEAGYFDRVVSSLFFHHLTTEAKRKTLAEVHRILKHGGELHVADWGKARNPLMRLAFLGIQLLDGFTTTADNVAGRLPDLMMEAGFRQVVETRRFETLFGTLSLYLATVRKN